MSALSTISQPLLTIEEKKQLYTGCCTTTLSPGLVKALMIAEIAGTTPLV